jgi:micrococcal nuclease
MSLRKATAIVVLGLALLFQGNVSLASPNRTEARVIKVHDGDTVSIVMDGKEYRTRLIGIDAPEIGQEPWGRRAKKHLIEILIQHKWKVLVETDVVILDKYDRLLVYLWTPDNELINERMVLDGFAVLFTIQPNSKYVNRLKKAQHIARDKKTGIWGADRLEESPMDYRMKHPRE